jgi:hypothetical protein
MEVAALIADITTTHHDCLRREVLRIEQLATMTGNDDAKYGDAV